MNIITTNGCGEDGAYDPDHLASLAAAAVASRKAWMIEARRIVIGTSLLFSGPRRRRVRNCIAHARRCSRASWQMNRS